jgi:hypothetical protein
MIFNRRYLSFSAIALVATLCLSACHSSNNPPPANAQNPQTTQNAPQAAPPSNAQPNPAPNSGPASAPAVAPAPQPATVIDLPKGTRLRIRLDEDLGSKISEPGQAFKATIADNIVVDGQTIIPRGARAEGTVVDAKPLGRFKGGARLEVRLERIHTKWGSYPVSTSAIERAEQGKGQRSASFIGGGAGLGAIIGGIAGGGKGALIGGLAGGGAGTAGSALTGNKQIFLPAETLLTFRLERPVHITQQP